MMTIKFILGLLLIGAALFTSACVFNSKSKAPTTVGKTNGQLSKCPSSPNCVSSHATDAQHSVAALPFSHKPDQAWQHIQSIISTLPKTKIITVETHYLHVEFTSSLLQFVDDVELTLEESDQLIHVRSASRIGYSDFGQNRKRVEQLRELFSQEQ